MIKCVTLKKEQIQNISKQLETTEEDINILRKDLSETKECTSQIKSRITKDFSCMKDEKNTLVFTEQERKAAQQKTETSPAVTK